MIWYNKYCEFKKSRTDAYRDCNMLLQVERPMVHKAPESVISCLDLGGDSRAWYGLIQNFTKYEGDNL